MLSIERIKVNRATAHTIYAFTKEGEEVIVKRRQFRTLCKDSNGVVTLGDRRRPKSGGKKKPVVMTMPPGTGLVAFIVDLEGKLYASRWNFADVYDSNVGAPAGKIRQENYELAGATSGA